VKKNNKTYQERAAYQDAEAKNLKKDTTGLCEKGKSTVYNRKVIEE